MKIEKYLALNKYILFLFGVDEFKVLQERLKTVEGRKSPEPKEEYIKNHVLFLDDKEWPDKLFKELK